VIRIAAGESASRRSTATPIRNNSVIGVSTRA
jgi:hypothetical protein